MPNPEPNITVNVDITNPGQFFACCGLLELADRLWPGAEGWFDGDHFLIAGPPECSLHALLDKLAASIVANTMAPEQNARLESLSTMTKKQREATPGLEDEKKNARIASSRTADRARRCHRVSHRLVLRRVRWRVAIQDVGGATVCARYH